jgi:tRNA G18 (ribose-2'-O)-methylase SpoU
MKRNSIIIILNNIRSTLNVGAIFRTADAVLAEEVIISGITATPEHSKVAKTALGAENMVPWIQLKDITDAVERVRKKGYTLVALEIDKSAKCLWEADLSNNIAILIGNEVDGISQELLDMCNQIVKIPMLGQKESLNVATALGIVAYESLHQHMIAKKQH